MTGIASVFHEIYKAADILKAVNSFLERKLFQGFICLPTACIKILLKIIMTKNNYDLKIIIIL